MTVISRVIKGLQAFKRQAPKITLAVIKSRNGLIVELQQEQLERGEDNTGKFIAPKYRNDRYARGKQAQNPKPPFGTPDLKKTGKYHRAFKEKYSSKEIKVNNTDSKDESLSKKYDNIKGLNDTSLTQLRTKILPDLRQELKNMI